jgi:hypothetical protein
MSLRSSNIDLHQLVGDWHIESRRPTLLEPCRTEDKPLDVGLAREPR